MSASWSSGSTTRWRRIRAEILARDNYECQLRYSGTWTTRTGQTRRCLGRATCVHHTRGRRATGDDPRYLVAACEPCNLRAGDPTSHADPPPTPITRW